MLTERSVSLRVEGGIGQWNPLFQLTRSMLDAIHEGIDDSHLATELDEREVARKRESPMHNSGYRQKLFPLTTYWLEFSGRSGWARWMMRPLYLLQDEYAANALSRILKQNMRMRSL